MAEDKTNGVPDELTPGQEMEGWLRIVRKAETPGREEEAGRDMEAFMKRLRPLKKE